ncbi:MAG TPA: proton-conducting transporter membrane subunit [Candidatus Binataceae bacterium]|nr:proton-conducting transporter membrane subunit [Candidatus Binataceae bacterium]
MTPLIPLVIAIPMVVAALLVVLSSLAPRQFADTVSIATAASVTAICAIILHQSAHGTLVYWFGNWVPVHGFAIGIAFVADPLSAGLATLVAALSLAALVFSWHYFEAVGTLYHALMLIFMSAMIGFSLTGDLFNMFVFFELMSVAAYALTGYKIEEESALEGAINFAVTNSIGAFFILIGIALLYGKVSALNMAQIGRVLAHHRADGLIICALTFVVIGFLIKAAIVPFHFWLSDAHAVAPTPVCVLFSGVMVELGAYGIARIYWTVFSGVTELGRTFGATLLGFGIATAILGAVMCLLQRHLKRLLAFSTISHMGLVIIGIAALSPIGLASSAIYVLGHGLVKGALFICSGIILDQAGSVDEIELMPRRVRSPFLVPLIPVYAAAALGLAGLPPFTTAVGKSLLEHGFHGGLQKLVVAAAVVSSAFTGAAVLRAGGRIFFGWGPRTGEESEAPTELRSERETEERSRLIPSVMLAPAAALVALALLFGVTPGLSGYASAAASQVQNQPRYESIVLDGHQSLALHPAQKPELSWTTGFVATGLAIALAAFELFGGHLPKSAIKLVGPVAELLHTVHSGQIGDYVTWMVVGVSILGTALAANLLFR